MDISNIRKSPLVISLNGGLGNQLFMLAAGISKAINEKRDYLIYLEVNKRPYYFDNIMKQLYGRVLNYNSEIKIEINNIYNEPYFHYKEIPDNYDLIKGYFQSYRYFTENYSKVKEELMIDYYKDSFKINLKSIAIHFRLGDYLELTHYHKITSFVYYLKAIKYLKEKLSDFDEYVFVIFGEKADNNIIDKFLYQINHNLDKPINYIKIYDRYPNNKNDYAELFYMSNCNHIIMGNSTFSWWSSYISDNDNSNSNSNLEKIIIYPSKTKWFAEEVNNNYNFNDFFPSNWIEIDY
jgi:hypothetical protein